MAVSSCTMGYRVKHGDAVPTRLDLNRQVALPAKTRLLMMENLVKRSVFERSFIDVSYPIVIKDG